MKSDRGSFTISAISFFWVDMKNSSKVVRSSAVLLGALAPVVSTANLFFNPYTGDPVYVIDYGFFPNSENWIGPNGQQAPTPTDSLFITANRPTSIFASDFTGTLGGTWMAVDNVFLDGTGELRFAKDPWGDPANDLAGIQMSSLQQNVNFLSVGIDLDILGRYNLAGNLNIVSGTTLVGDGLRVGSGGRAAVLNGARLLADVYLEDTVGAGLTAIWRNSSFASTNFMSNRSSGRILDMVAPINPGETDPYVPGGSTGSITTLQVDSYGGGTMVTLADGSAADPALSPETSLTIDDVRLFNNVDNTVFDISRGGTLRVNNEIYSASNDDGLTTLFNISSGGTAFVNQVDTGSGTILGTVTGAGSLLDIGSVRMPQGDFQFGNPMVRATAGGEVKINVADVDGHSEPLFIADDGKVSVSSLILRNPNGDIVRATNGSIVDLGATNTTAWGNTFAFRANNSTLKIGDSEAAQHPDPRGSTLLTNSVGIEATNGSILKTYAALFQGIGDVSVTLNNSRWEGFKTDPSTGLNVPRRTVLSSSSGVVTLQAGSSVIDGIDLDVFGRNNIDIVGSTLNFDLDVSGQGDLDIAASSGKIGNLNLASLTGQEQRANILNSTLAMAGISVNGFGAGNVNAVIQNSQVTTSMLNVGANNFANTTGTANLTIRNNSAVGTTRLNIGAAKYYPNGVATSFFGGNSTVNVQSGSRLAVGSYRNADPNDAFWVNSNIPEFPAIITLGPDSFLNIDATSSVYLGAANNESEQNFDLQTLTVGTNGVLNGSGGLNGWLFVDGGRVDLGFSPGKMSVTGNLAIDAGSLDFELGGLTAGTEYDQMEVLGNIALNGGKIRLGRFGGFVTNGFQEFQLFTGFSSITIGSAFTFEVGEGLVFDGFDPLTGRARVQAVPEPATMAVLGLGVLAMVRKRRRG